MKKQTHAFQKTIAAVLIVKNEMRTIEKCLDALDGAVDQIVVVDTGSTDGTDVVVEKKGIQVHPFEWKDDFSEARNYALSLATTDWAISIDADEILYAEDKDALRSLAIQYEPVHGAFALQIMIMNAIGQMVSPQRETRMFPLNRGLFWFRPIHEQLITKDSNKIPVYAVDARVWHDGYDPQIVDIREKYQRNIRILEKHVEAHPDDAVSHSFLGRENLMVGQLDSAIHHLQIARTLYQSNGEVIALAETERNLLLVLDQKGNYEQAEIIAKHLTDQHPDYLDGWYLSGFLQMKKASAALQKAQSSLKQSVHVAATKHHTTDTTIGQFKAILHLADTQRLGGNWLEARNLYLEVLRRMPNFPEVRNILDQMDKTILELADQIRESK